MDIFHPSNYRTELTFAIRRTRNDQRRCWGRGGEKPRTLTIDIEGEVGCIAAHVACGCAAIGTTVTLVQKGEDESALLGHLEGWLAAFLYPHILLGTVEIER